MQKDGCQVKIIIFISMEFILELVPVGYFCPVIDSKISHIVFLVLKISYSIYACMHICYEIILAHNVSSCFQLKFEVPK